MACGMRKTAGEKHFISKVGDVVVGRIGDTASAALAGLAAFAVAIDSTGSVSTAQYASLKHGSADNPDTSEAVSGRKSDVQGKREGLGGSRTIKTKQESICTERETR